MIRSHAISADGILRSRPKTKTVRRRAAENVWLPVILVALPIIAIPFENQYTFFGVSLAKLTILPVGAVALLLYPSRLFRLLKEPVVVAGLLFVAWGAISETFHSNSNLEFLYRVLQMLIFATLIGTVVNTPRILSGVLAGVVAVSVLLALYLIFNFYGLVDIGGGDFKAASSIRKQAFEEMSLQVNLNILAYTVAMGAVIAAAKLLERGRILIRIIWGGAFLICAVGAMVPASRGAFLGLLCSCGVLVLRSVRSANRRASLILVIPVAIASFIFMPDSLATRLSFSGKQDNVAIEKQEGRVRVYTAALESFPQYWAFGIGIGRYFNGWSQLNGFDGLGPHNGFLAAWIYLGLPSFLLLCLICVMAALQYQRMPGHWLDKQAILGLLVLALLWLLFTHDLYLKQFGVVLGLLVCATSANVGMSTRQLRRALSSRQRLMRIAAANAARNKTAPQPQTKSANLRPISHFTVG